MALLLLKTSYGGAAMKRFVATVVLTLLGGALFFVASNTTNFPHSDTAIFDPLFQSLGSFGTFLRTALFYTAFFGFAPALVTTFVIAPENAILVWSAVLLQSALIGLFVDFLRCRWHIVRRS